MRQGLVVVVVSFLYAASALAQGDGGLPMTGAGAAAPKGGEPKTAGANPYRSAFEQYRPFGEEPLKDWRTANEEVREAGGHIGLMKSAQPTRPRGHGAHGAMPPEGKSGKK